MKRLKDIVLEVLEGSVDQPLEDMPEWDSFNRLVFACRVEAEFKVKFSMEEILSYRSVGGVKKLLEKYGVNLVEV